MNSSFVKKPVGGWSEEKDQEEIKSERPKQRKSIEIKSAPKKMSKAKTLVKPVKAADKQEVVLKKWEEKLGSASQTTEKPSAQRKRIPLKSTAKAPLKVVKRK